jgi:hypothetical protein
MKLFTCQHCDQVLYFENTRCEKCGHRLGYLAEANVLSALEPVTDATSGENWRALAAPDQPYRFCANAAHDVCNWLIPVSSPEPYCIACRHNRMVPDLAQPDNVLAWRKLEQAKHRLIYTLLRLRLPLRNRNDEPNFGLVFDFLAEVPEQAAPKVMTGHDNGVITIALAEADDTEREKRRHAMGEPYRTLLGHFRHEVGHYFWDRLVGEGDKLVACREIFGDETMDYGQALLTYYDAGAPVDWQNNFVSAYATAHPWEDFAETWAHYLHIVDTLEMANAFGLRIKPAVDKGAELAVAIDFDPYMATNIEQITDAWLPLTFAVNSLNRCMGVADLYPFILAPAVIRKLGFIHDLLRAVHPEDGNH